MMYDHYRIFNGRDIVKELGEPLFVEYGDTWIFLDNEKGFICFNKSYKRVKYLFVFKPFRGFGIGSELVSLLPSQYFEVTATKMSKTLFEKAGFQITKSFTNYFKMKKYE